MESAGAVDALDMVLGNAMDDGRVVLDVNDRLNEGVGLRIDEKI